MKQRLRIGLLVSSKVTPQSLLEFRVLTKSLNDIGHKAFLLASLMGEHVNQEPLENGNSGEYKIALKFAAQVKKLKLQAIIFSNFRLASILISTKTLVKGKLKLIFIQDKSADDLKGDRLNVFRFNQLDALISPLHATANEIRGFTQLPQNKIHIHSSPIRLSKPKSAEALREKFRNEQKLSSDKLVLGLELRKDRALPKEVHTLLRCLSQSELLRNRLFIAVSYKSTSALEQTEAERTIINSLRELGMQQSYVQFESSIKQSEFLSILDIALLIADYEPFNALAFHALARGIHCLGSSTLVTTETLGNGKHGWLYNRGSEDSMFETIGYLLHHIDQKNNPLEAPIRTKRPKYAKAIAQIIQEAIDPSL